MGIVLMKALTAVIIVLLLLLLHSNVAEARTLKTKPRRSSVNLHPVRA